MAVAVATPTPTPSPTPLPTATPEPTSTPLPPPTPVPVEEAPAEEAPAEEAVPAEGDGGPPPVAAAKGNLPFGYGIQVDPRGNTQNNISLIKGMGFNWVKFQMAWKDVEPSPGGYSWGMWDEVINAYGRGRHSSAVEHPQSTRLVSPPR